MLSGIWTVVSGGVEKTAADWGIGELSRTRQSGRPGTLKFTMAAAAVDSVPVFASQSSFQLKRSGIGWFTGTVTKIPRRGTPNSESLSYVVSDPWWYLRTFFQQQWVTLDPDGGAGATMTTTRSRIIGGQSLDGTKLDLGQVMLEVLYYALYAAQGIPYPDTVAADSLPLAPSMTAGPFQIGTLTPDIVEPYFEVKDKKCAELIALLLRYVPDAVEWFDFTTTPPTLNIDSRANLGVKTISVLDGTVTSGFSPTARYDLQVPVVIIKYEQTITNDSVTYDSLTVDKYPPDVLDNTPGAFVQTVDLLPGNATYQHQDVTVVSLPVSAGGTATLPWVKAHIACIFGTTSAPTIYDIANISVSNLYAATLDPQDPAVLNPPTGFVLHDMVAELTGGAVTKWMSDDQSIYAALVIIPVQLTYSGSDALTAALFTTDPTHPGTRMDYIRVRATNADTMTYKQLTSAQQPEPVPVGNAQLLYKTLSVLHQEGTLELTEPECTDRLPIGCVFNTSDGLPEWQTMNALVLSVEEQIDRGVTRVEFGPTLALGLGDLVELARANRGRLASFRLDQRTSGQAGNSNAVIGHTHTPHSSTSSAPAATPVDPFPFQALWRINPADPTKSTFQFKLELKSNLASTNLYTNLVITGLDTWTALNANDTAWLIGTVTQDSSGNLAVTPGTPTIHSYGQGNSDYNPSAAPGAAGSNVEFSGAPPVQTLFRRVIFVSTADALGHPSIEQKTMTDLAMRNTYLGNPCLYPLTA